MKGFVIVTGATSQLGVFLLPRLQAAGCQVLALSRKAPAVPHDVSAQVSWQHPRSVIAENEIKGLQNNPDLRYLVSCGPLDLAHAVIASHPEIERVVAFSTSSVLTKRLSGNPGESGAMVRIREQELTLERQCQDRGISLVLLRPTLIYGCGLDNNISALARFACRFGLVPVANRATGLRQPVHADDLAALAVRMLTLDQPVSLNSEACGGNRISYRDMVEKVAACCGENTRVIGLPSWLMIFALRIARINPAFRAFNSEMIRRQSRDMVFDDTILREMLGFQPRTFEPTPADFKVPDYCERLQYSA